MIFSHSQVLNPSLLLWPEEGLVVDPLVVGLLPQEELPEDRLPMVVLVVGVVLAQVWEVLMVPPALLLAAAIQGLLAANYLLKMAWLVTKVLVVTAVVVLDSNWLQESVVFPAQVVGRMLMV